MKYLSALIAVGLGGYALSSCTTSSEHVELEFVACQESSITQSFSELSEEDISTELAERVSVYDAMTGRWEVDYHCTNQAVRVVNVEISLPDHDEIDMVVGPPEDLDESIHYYCDALGFSEGELTMSGTEEPVLDGRKLPLFVDLMMPDEQHPDKTPVEGHIDQTVEGHDEFDSFHFFFLVENEGISEHSYVMFEQSYEPDSSDGSGDQPTINNVVLACFLENWVRIESPVE
ncbi:hypothetical protein KAI87_17760 [Myxococcota bacterium]|nr:hypothetical protein [Myxococcota bacterium]